MKTLQQSAQELAEAWRELVLACAYACKLDVMLTYLTKVLKRINKS